MKNVNETVIRVKQSSVFDGLGALINGGLFIAIGIYFFDRNELLSFLVICASIRFSIYPMLDLCVSKKFFVDGDQIFIKCWGVRFKLSREKSFLRIDNMFVLSPINAKFPTLNIYRNPSTFLGRLFKNKIKLYSISKENFEEARREAHRISQNFGIPFRDVYEVQ